MGDVDPDEPVVGAGLPGREGLAPDPRQATERIVVRGPEHPGVLDRGVPRWEHIVHPQVAGPTEYGFAEVGGSCQKTAAYTFSTQDYTFHDEVQTKAYTFHTETTGPAPIISEFSTQDVCPSGYNLEDYGAQGKLCRQYGPAPTAQVKDAAPSGWTDNGSSYVRTVEVKDNAPAGFTDDGTQWIKKDAAPSGWSDDGTQYVKTTAKVARTVPA